MKNYVTNTEAEARTEVGGLCALLGGTQGILDQEARGARQFAASETLPRKMQGNAQRVLEAAGVKFLDNVEGDPLFRYAELPAGWSKRPTDHSMWTELVDDKGRVRGRIFYKAAFYDRDAFIGVCSRFVVRPNYTHDKEYMTAEVFDGDTIIYTSPQFRVQASARWLATDEAVDNAFAWLKSEYPDCEDPGAYWS